MAFRYVLGMCLLAVSSAAACSWDSNTLRDELSTRQIELVPLLLGQLPHHGASFWEAQVARSQAKLVTDSESWEVRNDLAVASMKLGSFDRALAEFTRLDQQEPNRYETLSNLGVLAKKRGRYGEAARYIREALEIKPEGHMGLGDWYLRMLTYRAAEGPPQTNFLGEPYALLPQGIEPRIVEGGNNGLRVANRERLELLMALIRNDSEFPDSYLVLGDLLSENYAWDLAALAYGRALQLEHPRPDVVRGRIAQLLAWQRADLWTSWPGVVSLDYVVGVGGVVADVRQRIETAASWSAAFARTEAAFVAAGHDAGFQAVEAELLQQGVARDGRLSPALLVQSGALGAFLRLIPFLVLVWLVLGGYRLVRRGVRRMRRAPELSVALPSAS